MRVYLMRDDNVIVWLWYLCWSGYSSGWLCNDSKLWMTAPLQYVYICHLLTSPGTSHSAAKVYSFIVHIP